MFAVENLAKSYGGTAALGPVSLAFERGRTAALIGPSGCGKSTLLRMLLGLIESDGGRVTFDGIPVEGANLRPIRRRVGYVIQDGGLFPHLTARGNVALMARHLKWDEAKIEARIAELAKLARFPMEALDRPPSQLSGGQRQRVGLIRALMLDPDALLLDEPLGALDPLVRAELQDDLRDVFHTLNKTVILVTHDLAEAAFFADRLILLRAGQVVQDGPPESLRDAPADPFVTKFLKAQRGWAIR